MAKILYCLASFLARERARSGEDALLQIEGHSFGNYKSTQNDYVYYKAKITILL